MLGVAFNALATPTPLLEAPHLSQRRRPECSPPNRRRPPFQHHAFRPLYVPYPPVSSPLGALRQYPISPLPSPPQYCMSAPEPLTETVTTHALDGRIAHATCQVRPLDRVFQPRGSTGTALSYKRAPHVRHYHHPTGKKSRFLDLLPHYRGGRPNLGAPLMWSALGSA